jgi:hypothetical protein
LPAYSEKPRFSLGSPIQFKEVPLPQQCAFEVTATAPTGPPTSTNADGITAPTAEPLFPLSRTAELIAAKSPVVARVNLSDERTTLLFLNLQRSRRTELLNGQRQGSQAAAVTAGDPVGLFLAHFPTIRSCGSFSTPAKVYASSTPT